MLLEYIWITKYTILKSLILYIHRAFFHLESIPTINAAIYFRPFLYNKLHHYWLISEFRTLVIGCVSPHNASVTNKRLLQNLNTLSIHSLNCWIKLNFLPSYFTLNNSWNRHTAGLQITFNIHSMKKIQNFNLTCSLSSLLAWEAYICLLFQHVWFCFAICNLMELKRTPE